MDIIKEKPNSNRGSWQFGASAEKDYKTVNISRKKGPVFKTAVGLLGLAVLLAAGLYVYNKFLESKKNKLINEAIELNKQRNLELEEKFIALRITLNNMKAILEKRSYPKAVFKMIEELTMPKVLLTGFGMDFKSNSIDFSLETVSYGDLARQIIVFKEDSRVNKVITGGININDSGRLTANLNIELNPSLLLK